MATITPASPLMAINTSKAFSSDISGAKFHIVDPLITASDPVIENSAYFVSTSSERLEHSYTASPFGGSQTGWVCAWVLLNGSSNSNDTVFDFGTSTCKVTIYYSGSLGRFVVGLRNTDLTINKSLTSVNGKESTSRWVFLLVTWDADAGMKFWVDSTPMSLAITPTATGMNFAAVGKLRIGCPLNTTSTNYHFNGNIASPCFGTEYLTTDQVKLLFNRGAGRNYASLTAGEKTALGLISFWDLDETSGTRADSESSYDLSDINTVTHGSGVTPRGIRTLELTATERDEYSFSSNTLSIADDLATEFKVGASEAIWAGKDGATVTERSDGVLEVHSAVYAWAMGTPNFRLKAQGDFFEYIVPFANQFQYFRVRNAHNDSGQAPYVYLYAGSYREATNATGIITYTAPFNPGVGDIIKFLWNASDRAEVYINGVLIYTGTTVNLSTESEWIIEISGSAYSTVGDILYPPRFGGPSLSSYDAAYADVTITDQVGTGPACDETLSSILKEAKLTSSVNVSMLGSDIIGDGVKSSSVGPATSLSSQIEVEGSTEAETSGEGRLFSSISTCGD